MMTTAAALTVDVMFVGGRVSLAPRTRGARSTLREFSD